MDEVIALKESILSQMGMGETITWRQYVIPLITAVAKEMKGDNKWRLCTSAMSDYAITAHTHLPSVTLSYGFTEDKGRFTLKDLKARFRRICNTVDRKLFDMFVCEENPDSAGYTFRFRTTDRFERMFIDIDYNYTGLTLSGTHTLSSTSVLAFSFVFTDNEAYHALNKELESLTRTIGSGII